MDREAQANEQKEAMLGLFNTLKNMSKHGGSVSIVDDTKMVRNYHLGKADLKIKDSSIIIQLADDFTLILRITAGEGGKTSKRKCAIVYAVEYSVAAKYTEGDPLRGTLIRKSK